LLSKEKIEPDEVENLTIAIPGKYTTANLLLGIAYPNIAARKEYLFSDIEEAILNGEVDAGLAIHENRFTYAEKGLKKILDLGDYWQNLSGRPIPLGGIVVKRDLAKADILKINRVLRKSIEFAFSHTNEVMPYIKKFAQEMEEDVMLKHINLYVNNYSLDLGDEGKSAIRKLYEFAEEKQLIPEVNKSLFVSDL
jgi:1,4-dihydroxy-6-naphthoate synthase